MTDDVYAIVAALVIGSAYAIGFWRGTRSAARLSALMREELEEYDRSFRLYDQAVRALTRAWHQEHQGCRHLLPDTAKLCKWAADRIAGPCDVCGDDDGEAA